MMTIPFTRTLFERLSEFILLLLIIIFLTVSYTSGMICRSEAARAVAEQESTPTQDLKQKEAVAGSLAQLRLRAGLVPVLSLAVVHHGR